jgi:3-dehydroquinate synthase
VTGKRAATGGGGKPTDSGEFVIQLSGYQVIVARGLLDRVGDHCAATAPAHRYIVIADSNVAPIYGARVLASFGNSAVSLLEIRAGESGKTRESWSAITDRLLATGHGRDTTVVALGGGVVGDLAGFVAATYMRGVPYVQVPTTLLAMIDASVGGKTGVDTGAGKNLVGAFHNPSVVLADPDVLESLAEAELRSGLAEAIKHGVIADASYLAKVRSVISTLSSASAAERGALLGSIIARSVEIKAGVVEADGREAGIRKILNFGHTVGHAVELLSGYSLLHGEAVAIGMVVESRLGEQLGVSAEGTADAVSQALELAGLPVRVPTEMRAADIIAAMRADKKVRGGRHELALPAEPGRMAGADSGWVIPVPEEEILTALTALTA